MSKLWLLFFSAVAVFLFALSVATGPASVSLFSPSPADWMILFNLRLPRALSAFLVGGGLSLSGAIFQGLFRNPLADSYLLGISSGAGLGAALAIVLGLASPVAYLSSVTFFSFCGSLLALWLVFAFASQEGYISPFRLLLSGLGIGLFFSSLVAILMLLAEEELKALVFFFLGGFSHASWETASLALVLIPPAVALAFLFSRELNVLLLGEETALSSGLDVKKIQVLFSMMAAFLTSVSVSVAGLIGFVGLIVPHINRMLVGAEHRKLFALTFISGGAFLIFCDTLAKLVLQPSEIPVGIVTSLCGVPFFLYLLKKEKGEYAL